MSEKCEHCGDDADGFKCPHCGGKGHTDHDLEVPCAVCKPTPAPSPGEVGEAVKSWRLDAEDEAWLLATLADLQAQVAARDAEIARLRRVAEAANSCAKESGDEEANILRLHSALKDAGYE